MKNYNLQNVLISNKELQEDISNYISGIYTNDITIPKIINDVLSYHKEINNNNTEEASLNIITTLQTITQYL
jgi:hypothetical protein